MLLLRRKDEPIPAFFRWCTFVTLTPIVCAILFSSFVHGAPDFGFLRDRFGLMYIPFALLGWGGSWLRKAGSSPSPITLT
jgi:hypothetical protein